MNLLKIILLLFVADVAFCQGKPAKIVFDITSADTLAHQTVVRHVNLMAQSYPGIQLEVVVYGGALPMLMTDKSTEAKEIQELAKNANIAFRACEGTMKRYKVTKTQLLPGVGTVPDAIMEIVQKQGEGWGYIKEVPN